jgi:TFIIF-interacting CTD phosphatase-like protein
MRILSKKKKILTNQGIELEKLHNYHLVLDIDETLIHSSVSDNKTSIYLRPNIKFFLNYCYKHFNVGYWTLGTKKYCLHILHKILTKEQFERTKETSVIISRCDEGNKYEEILRSEIFEVNKLDNHFTKPLQYLFDHPIYGSIFKKQNTLLIDNNPIVTGVNPHNSILIPSFYNDTNDNYLLLIIKWLEKVKGNIVKMEKPVYFVYK